MYGMAATSAIGFTLRIMRGALQVFLRLARPAGYNIGGHNEWANLVLSELPSDGWAPQMTRALTRTVRLRRRARAAIP